MLVSPEPTAKGEISTKSKSSKVRQKVKRTGQFPEHSLRLNIFTHSRKFILAKKQ